MVNHVLASIMESPNPTFRSNFRVIPRRRIQLRNDASAEGWGEAHVPADSGRTFQAFFSEYGPPSGIKPRCPRSTFDISSSTAQATFPSLLPAYPRTSHFFSQSLTMAFQSTMSRLAAVALVLLSLGFLVQASPIAAPAGKEVATIEERTGKNCYGEYCYGGRDIMAIMLLLQKVIEAKLALLDGCLGGGDYAAIIGDIEGSLYAAIGAIKEYHMSMVDFFSGQIMVIAQIWFAIVISVATHCAKWISHAEWAAFVVLAAKMDLALKLCLLAICDLGGAFSGYLAACIALFTQAHIALLSKVQFILCLGAMHLGGY
ncbi:unnamed protein product [Rhizoctonia solani]|uniref:Uncharacterized protein n=1 Tax=Rhizoctonia solani TaxID=456999 RepID=A0A8H3DR03_9AGAM|nr:unnamed protein product [Rhizoctonia solani]